MFNDDFIINLLLNVKVKEFWKSGNSLIQFWKKNWWLTFLDNITSAALCLPSLQYANEGIINEQEKGDIAELFQWRKRVTWT